MNLHPQRQKGSIGMISLLLAVLIISFLFIRQYNQYHSGGVGNNKEDNKAAIDKAEEAKKMIESQNNLNLNI